MKAVALLLLVTLSLPVFAAPRAEDLFPVEPRLMPQPDDSVLVTEDFGITVGGLRLAAFTHELYQEARLYAIEADQRLDAAHEIGFDLQRQTERQRRELRVTRTVALMLAGVLAGIVVRDMVR